MIWPVLKRDTKKELAWKILKTAPGRDQKASRARYVKA